MSRPLWWVRRRGRSRLHMGFCPWCYSSPPHSACPVCLGGPYGHHMRPERRLQTLQLWRARFADAVDRLAAGTLRP